MIWSDCYGRWHFFYYVGAYECHVTKRLQTLPCVCERREWEILKKPRREHLPKDIKLINISWRTVSSFEKDKLWYDRSNHYTFKQVRVLSPLTAMETPIFGKVLEMMRSEGDNLLPTNLILI